MNTPQIKKKKKPIKYLLVGTLLLILIIGAIPLKEVDLNDSSGKRMVVDSLSLPSSQVTAVEDTEITEEALPADHDITSFSESAVKGSVSQQIRIPDPTGNTAGYIINDTTESFELMQSRGQTSRHWYDPVMDEYQYSSDSLVNQTGTLIETDWVTEDEFLYRFFIQFQTGSRVTFNSYLDIATYITTLDPASIWAVGFEGFSGAMAFYLNSADLISGHGQYVYWPRLLNGQLTAFDHPIFAFYPHLYVKIESEWIDQILCDRSLFSNGLIPSIASLDFYASETEFGITYTVSNAQIQDTTWTIKHGFKYRMNNQQFHKITELICHNQDLDDVSLTYDITHSPQASNTDFEPETYRIKNSTDQILLPANMPWNAEERLDEFETNIEIISINKQGLRFSFGDLELSGFTKPILELISQSMPDESFKMVLRAGMTGLGSLQKEQWLQIDPSTGTIYSTDNYDLYKACGAGSYTTGDTVMKVGIVGGYPTSSAALAYMAFNTGINDIIDSISSPSMQIYYTTGDTFESDEGISLRVYNIVGSGNGADSNTLKEDSQSYSLGTNSLETLVWGHQSSAGYASADTNDLDDLLEYWALYRGSSENWVSFRLEGYGMDAFTSDAAIFSDSQTSGTSQDPKLSFTYAFSETASISGYVTDTDNTSLAGIHVDLYQDSTSLKVAGDLTDSNGFYEFSIEPSSSTHLLYAWDPDYLTQNIGLTPRNHKEVNFTLAAETIPSPQAPLGCHDPSNYTGGSSWLNVTSAYSNGTYYAIGNDSTNNITYNTYNWDVPGNDTQDYGKIKGVYVLIHWKSVINDRVAVRLRWSSSNGDWHNLAANSSWNLAKLNYTDAATWYLNKINSINFRVEIGFLSQNSVDAVLIDWVGTLVEYYDVRAEDIVIASGSSKGINQTFGLKFKNYGTLTPSTTVDVKVKIEALNYTNYHTWVDEEYHYLIGTLDPGETSSVPMYRYFPYIFQGYNDSSCENWDGWFAMNIGVYNITEVFVYTSVWNSTTSFSDELFEVQVQGDHHKVFCVILEDPDFGNRYGSCENWDGSNLSDGYSGSDWKYQAWSSVDWWYNQRQDINIDLIPLVDSYNFTTNTTELPGDTHEGYARAKDFLGLFGNWTEASGTSAANHGFDLIWCLMGFVSGPAHGGYNRVMIKCVVASSYWNYPYENDSMFKTLQHELGHVFHALHINKPPMNLSMDDPDNPWVMSYKRIWNNWDCHTFIDYNLSVISDNADKFDGV